MCSKLGLTLIKELKQGVKFRVFNFRENVFSRVFNFAKISNNKVDTLTSWLKTYDFVGYKYHVSTPSRKPEI